jgi:ketosteroid isomerase-like protein
MNRAYILGLVLFVSCTGRDPNEPIQSAAQDERLIRDMIVSLNAALAKAYNGGGVNTDSLMDAYYEKNISYVTPWGWSEPLDSTKARLRNAKHHIRDFDNRIENLEVKVYGDGAYAGFILRQTYTVDGRLLEEYLPTTLVFERRGKGWKIVRVHRSTDYETFQQWVALQKGEEASK